jgi:uncharacterized membrane protein YphA (DoxX/SURF4 family)
MKIKPKTTLHNPAVAVWLLRLGLAIIFLYAGVSSLQHPLDWVGYLPNILTKSIAPLTLIKIFAVYELLLALWLATGWRLRYAAILCTATLATIMLTNTGQLITTFRDIGLAFAALALVFLE